MKPRSAFSFPTTRLDGRWRRRLMGRPSGATERIERRMALVNCLECGQCCKEGKGVLLAAGSPDRMNVAMGLRERQLPLHRLTQEIEGIFLLKFDPACPFLGEANTCSIYADRPRPCSEYPFETVFFLEEGRVQFYTYLSDRCPPLYALKEEEGIRAIFLSEIESRRLPLLWPAWEAVKQMFRSSSERFGGSPFLECQGEIVFPIGRLDE